MLAGATIDLTRPFRHGYPVGVRTPTHTPTSPKIALHPPLSRGVAGCPKLTLSCKESNTSECGRTPANPLLLAGGQVVAGSNPVSPTNVMSRDTVDRCLGTSFTCGVCWWGCFRVLLRVFGSRGWLPENGAVFLLSKPGMYSWYSTPHGSLVWLLRPVDLHQDERPRISHPRRSWPRCSGNSCVRRSSCRPNRSGPRPRRP